MARSTGIPHSPLVARKIPFDLHNTGEELRWCVEHKAKILTGVGILASIGIFLLLLIVYQRQQKANSLEKLRTGIVNFQSGKMEEAIPLLANAKESLGSQKEAQIAGFYLNEAYGRSGQFDRLQSITEVSSAPPEESYLSQIALLSLGRNAEKRNDQVSARKFYEAAVALEGPLTAEALLGTARLFEATGDQDSAVSTREKFLSSYPNSPFADIVRTQLRK
jgi:hypothetical protein